MIEVAIVHDIKKFQRRLDEIERVVERPRKLEEGEVSNPLQISPAMAALRRAQNRNNNAIAIRSQS